MTTPKSPDGSKNPAPPETGGEGNSGRDREGGDKRGPARSRPAPSRRTSPAAPRQAREALQSGRMIDPFSP